MACLLMLGLLSYGPARAGSQVEVKHAPYLQLGDAVLARLPGSETDQIEILWQTIPAGPGALDSFAVEFREAAAPDWTAAGPIFTIDTRVGGRINHFVTIKELQYDRDYDYRVVHHRSGIAIETYDGSFRTRLPAGADAAFTFAAYGDSARIAQVRNFRNVQSRINLIDPDFSVLLGDNVYDRGTHSQFDARLDPVINPELHQYIAGHVEYWSMGNHDAATAGGQPSLDNYSVPVPVAGTTSPVPPPLGEAPEKNYSFDYGNVHFATFDSNSLNHAARLDSQLDWLVADMNASEAHWKSVFAHHPVAGSPDKQESPGDDYYKQVVSRLNEADVDLFLAGYSHLYHRTFPLLGQSGGAALFVPDLDHDYSKGAGLIQVVSGVGGRSLRIGDFSPYPFDVVGFSLSTVPRVEYGFAKIDVSPGELEVSYIAADNGAILDAFTISDRRADVNDDLAIDSLDITPFILAMSVGGNVRDALGVDTFLNLVPDGSFSAADINFDRSVNNLDITPFIGLLAGAAAVPEPSAALALLTLAGLMFRRQSRTPRTTKTV